MTKKQLAQELTTRNKCAGLLVWYEIAETGAQSYVKITQWKIAISRLCSLLQLLECRNPWQCHWDYVLFTATAERHYHD